MRAPTFPWPGSITSDPLADARREHADAALAVERARRTLALCEGREEQKRARLAALEGAASRRAVA
jgi:hypothetical protein